MHLFICLISWLAIGHPHRLSFSVLVGWPCRAVSNSGLLAFRGIRALHGAALTPWYSRAMFGVFTSETKSTSVKHFSRLADLWLPCCCFQYWTTAQFTSLGRIPVRNEDTPSVIDQVCGLFDRRQLSDWPGRPSLVDLWLRAEDH